MLETLTRHVVQNCHHCIMRLLLHINHDVRLRNLTVYAQWVSLSAIIACWIREVLWLVVYIHFYINAYKNRHTPKSSVFLTIQILNILLFPVGPVAVIMPYLSKYSRNFFWLGIIWWYFFPLVYLSTNLTPFSGKRPEATFEILLYCLYPMASFTSLNLVLNRSRVDSASNTINTFLFHIAFTIWISLWVGNIQSSKISFLPVVRPHFEWAMVLAALATLLYFVALLKGHKIVLSRTLGGPGIEPMSLILHSSELEYNAITDEGRIQLT